MAFSCPRTHDPHDLQESSSSDSGSCSFSDMSESSGDEAEPHRRGASRSPAPHRQLCQYYNEGHCKYGSKCRNLHICKYFLRGECRYGSSCRLRHTTVSGSRSSADERTGGWGQRRRRRRRSSFSDEDSHSEGPYRWQINDGSGWKDIANDHIIEAQYSRPDSKGMTLYNTTYGAISIDFNKMKVRNKHAMRVRRRSSAQVMWMWYYRGDLGWAKFGDPDPRGKCSPVKSVHIEKDFQKNPKGTFSFSIGTTNYKITFKDLCQENLLTGYKRRVVRRPEFTGLCSAMQALSVSSQSRTPIWQFEGSPGKWYAFKCRQGTSTESSVSSSDVEAKYQQNPTGFMNFSVSNFCYRLNFSDMTQTNLTTRTTRQVRRILQ